MFYNSKQSYVDLQPTMCT